MPLVPVYQSGAAKFVFIMLLEYVKMTREINKYERNPANQSCLSQYIIVRCSAFEKMYIADIGLDKGSCLLI